MASEADRVADLVKAIRDGDSDAVRDMLAAAPELVGAHDDHAFGATPLIHAVMANSLMMVDLLLEQGAEIDQRSKWWAGSFGVLDHGSEEMATHLLQRGATLTPHAAARLGRIDELRAMLDDDPSLVHLRGGDGQLPLHFASTVEIARLLLEHGARLDVRDIDHESTAAQWLVSSNPTVAAFLVSQGCEADAFLAASVGDREILEQCVKEDAEGVNMRITKDRFSTRGVEAAEHIYFYTIGRNCTLLHAAVRSNHASIIRWLAEQGCDPNARGGYDDQTPLHAAAWQGATDSTKALLDAGADVDAPSGKSHKNEPIGWAIVSGASDVVRVLLDRGATVRQAHRTDADHGAEGEFRSFNRSRPLENWVEIQTMIRAK